MGAIDGAAVTEKITGKGKVIWGRDINEVLASMKVLPDFSFTSDNPQASFDYIHRNTNDADIYFLSNRFEYRQYSDFAYRYLPVAPDRYEQIDARFRVTGCQPQLWDPMTGTITDIADYREENGTTVIPLHFEPGGSKFIVFKKKATPVRHIVNIVKGEVDPNRTMPLKTASVALVREGGVVKAQVFQKGQYTLNWSDGTESRLHSNGAILQPVSGKWQLKLDPYWGTDRQLTLDSLKSWTDFDDPKVKYYSGKGHYTTRFMLASPALKGMRVYLDLGNVQDLAVVRVNDSQPQTLWYFPFRLDITDLVKPGANQLSVDVVNLWANRLIGDRGLPAGKRLTQTNIVKFEKEAMEPALRVSGLLGPVQLILVPEVVIK